MALGSFLVASKFSWKAYTASHMTLRSEVRRLSRAVLPLNWSICMASRKERMERLHWLDQAPVVNSETLLWE